MSRPYLLFFTSICIFASQIINASKNAQQGMLKNGSYHNDHHTIKLTNYADPIIVNTVFGTGRPQSTESYGLYGEINNPKGLTLDATEQFLYATDQNGGGMIRKITLTTTVDNLFKSGFKYDVKTLFKGVHFQICQLIVAGASEYLYVSSSVHNIKRLDINQETSKTYEGSIISGSQGGTSCSNRASPSCFGDADGLSTYARYNTISALAIQVDSNNTDKTLFVADRINNKIRQVDITVGGAFSTVTFASSVDEKGTKLQGLAVNSATNMLYAAVTAGVHSFIILKGAGSKAIYAGQISSVTGGK